MLGWCQGRNLNMDVQDGQDEMTWAGAERAALEGILWAWPVDGAGDGDGEVDAWVTGKELGRMEVRMWRSWPVGGERWARKMVRGLGLEQTVRSEGRPRAEVKECWYGTNWKYRLRPFGIPRGRRSAGPGVHAGIRGRPRKGEGQLRMSPFSSPWRSAASAGYAAPPPEGHT